MRHGLNPMTNPANETALTLAWSAEFNPKNVVRYGRYRFFASGAEWAFAIALAFTGWAFTN